MSSLSAPPIPARAQSRGTLGTGHTGSQQKLLATRTPSPSLSVWQDLLATLPSTGSVDHDPGAPIMPQGVIQGPDQRIWGPLGKGQARPPPSQRGEPAFPPRNLPGPLPTDGPATPADTHGHDDPHTPHQGPSVRRRSCWLPGGADVQPSCDPRRSRAAHVIPDPPSGGSVGLAGQPAHRSAGGARLVTSAQGHRATEGDAGPAPLREDPGARSTRLRTCPQPLLPQQPPPQGHSRTHGPGPRGP